MFMSKIKLSLKSGVSLAVIITGVATAIMISSLPHSALAEGMAADVSADVSGVRNSITLQEAVAKQAPPRARGFRPKMRYAHQGGSNPPIIVIHGTGLDGVPDSYTRYLSRTFMEAFKLQGTPLRIQFRSSSNPFAEKE